MNWEGRRCNKVLLQASSTERFVGVLIVLEVFPQCAKSMTGSDHVLHYCICASISAFKMKLRIPLWKQTEMICVSRQFIIVSLNPEL